MFNKKYKKGYKNGFLDGIIWMSDFLKFCNYNEMLVYLKNINNNLNYYSKEFKMSKNDLKRNVKVLIYSLKYFFEE